MSKFGIFVAAIVAVVLFFGLGLPALMPGCGLMDYALRDTVPAESGSVALPGLVSDAVVRRDELGIPLVEAGSMHDLAYAEGYVMAADRLAQMVSFSLLGQGRLSEMVGAIGLDIDVFIRTLGLHEAARAQFEALSPEMIEFLESFSAGVNAYIETHRERLPLDFQLTGYTPEAWEPINSMYILNMINLGLSFNLREEIAFLNLARVLGPEKAAWLFPVYPDEPLPFDKARALSDVQLNNMGGTLYALGELGDRLSRLLRPLEIAASNNWGVAPERTAKGASVIANDTHMPLEHPPVWMLMQLKAPDFHVGGIAMPGLPLIVAGYNGEIAWGMTMVMGDSQDIFIERIKQVDGKDHYEYQGEWLPVETRVETFWVKGEAPVQKAIGYTRHGPLLNMALASKSRNVAIPHQVNSDFGLALSTTLSAGENSFNGMLDLFKAKSMREARKVIRNFRLMHLNFIYGDADHIAWQVSGAYPLRKKGRGHLPSPGWTGEYDWDGYVSVRKHPYEKDPSRGYVHTANHRTVAPGRGPILGSSWYAPERAERIGQMLAANDQYDWKSAVAMQYDDHDLLVAKMKALFFDSALADALKETIDGWGDGRRAARAREALAIFRDFDGNMKASSAGAALTCIFHHVLSRNLFLDELGPDNSDAWQNYLSLCIGIYGPEQDHLLGRPMSPFWDNVRTTKRIETKADIVAASLADAVTYAERSMGRDRKDWQWGALHTYTWETQTSKMREHMPLLKRFGAWLISLYTDRGPYPAGGSYNTLNVSGYLKGDNFDVWLIPAMRLVVDFGEDEPVFLVNSGGQSGNPASPHFDDGIPVWLSGENRRMAFGQENIEKQYDQVLTLKAQPNK